MTPQETPRLAYECPGVSGGGVGQRWPAAGLGALSVAVHAWDHARRNLPFLSPDMTFFEYEPMDSSIYLEIITGVNLRGQAN